MLWKRVNYLRPVILFGMCLAFYPGLVIGEIPAEPANQFLYDSIFVTINTDYTAMIRHSQRIIFNRQPDNKYSNIRLQVNDYIKLEDISIITSLPDGRQIKLQKNDIQAISDFGPQFYPNSVTKLIAVPLAREQSQADINYLIHYSNLLYLPQFLRQRDVPTANSYLKINSEIPFHYFSSLNQFQIDSSGGALEFSAAEIPAASKEENSPVNDAYRIVIRPDTLVDNGRKYSFAGWGEVADFYNRISDISQPLDKRIIALSDSLCRNALTANDSLRAIYDFIRNDIRYISADIGRGDFKPAAPGEVLSRKYGDCKDKSSLLASLYRAAGFMAYPGLLTTSDKPEIINALPWPGFFNHVITVVNIDDGRLYLDPSLPSCCFDKLPGPCRNRQILVCGDNNNANLVVPLLADEGNIAEISLIYQINQFGDIHCQTRLAVSRDLAFFYYDDSREKVLANIQKGFLAGIPADQYQKTFQLEYLSPDMIIVNGDYFAKLQLLPKTGGVSFKLLSPALDYLKAIFNTENRLVSYEFPFPFKLKETVNLALPADLWLEEDSLSLNFGEPDLQYHYQAFSGDKVYRTYKYFQLGGYSLPPERYNRFSAFLLKTFRAVIQTIQLTPESNKDDKKSP